MTLPKKIETLAQLEELVGTLPSTHKDAIEGATERNAQLTKPSGSLGRLEEIAIWYAGWRGEPRPRVEAPKILIFAGNHGVTARNISAFPPEVTAQMVLNFEHGGAAINQLAKLAGAELQVFALDLDEPTKDFCVEPAMSRKELLTAINAGWTAVRSPCDLLVVGEMGIGNTTVASAILTALFGGDAADWVGPGTGLDPDGVNHKVNVVKTAVDRHKTNDPFEVLAALGGRELAAMVGAILRARFERIPLILDGFIVCAAAAVLKSANSDALAHTVAGHASAENAHKMVLSRLEKKPLLDLEMRLGEGSGAAVAIQIVKAALACHSGMATFAEAGVSDG